MTCDLKLPNNCRQSSRWRILSWAINSIRTVALCWVSVFSGWMVFASPFSSSRTILEVELKWIYNSTCAITYSNLQFKTPQNTHSWFDGRRRRLKNGSFGCPVYPPVPLGLDLCSIKYAHCGASITRIPNSTIGSVIQADQQRGKQWTLLSLICPLPWALCCPSTSTEDEGERKAVAVTFVTHIFPTIEWLQIA